MSTDRYFSHYFRINKIFLVASGILTDIPGGGIISGLCAIFSVLGSSVITIPSIYHTTYYSDEIPAIQKSDMLGRVAESAASGIKVLLLLPKRKEMLKLVAQLRELWEKVENEEDHKAVIPYASLSVRLTYWFTANVFAAFSSLIFVSTLSGPFVFENGTVVQSKALPHPFGIPHSDPREFYLWFWMQIISGTLVVIAIIAVDAGASFFVLQGCAHFKLLGEKLREIGEDFEKTGRAEGQERTAKDLAKFVDHHRTLFTYCQMIEDVFTDVIFLETVFSIGAICVFGFNTLLQDEGRIIFICHIMGGVQQLFMFCWPPDDLQSVSEDVAFTAYNLPWYDWPTEQRRNVRIIMSRSQKPVIMTCKQFATMSLQTFSSILSSSFSFFTVLRNMV